MLTTGSLTIETIHDTPLLKRMDGILMQLFRLKVKNLGGPVQSELVLDDGLNCLTIQLGNIPGGNSSHDIMFPEITKACRLCFILRAGNEAVHTLERECSPHRRWTVHVVQSSHHDPGYTDLPSTVLRQQNEYLDKAIDMAAATRSFPFESQFRIVAEQAWSIDHYLKTVPEARAAEMIRLMKSGHIELTALFGNMVTELCGHETLARTVYHAARLKRLHGIPLVSAEHNDVPGFTWGLSHVLCEAGIKIFLPALPCYYDWGSKNLPSFWDEKVIFGGAKDMPGAFWWEAPSGKRILFWLNSMGDCVTSLPHLGNSLADLEEQAYPYDTIRWPVKGAMGDNSPYSEAYAHTIRCWNREWENPKLICSTNTMFYESLLPNLPKTLPVWRGGVPGQDYPAGATSTAASTAVTRRTHTLIPAAERLSTAASVLVGASYPKKVIGAAYEEALWHDEHLWGHHFPCGPAARASELEKAVQAHRAEAFAHEVANKAMARISDSIRLDSEGIHLVVFNPLPSLRTDMACAALREIDNCGCERIIEKGADGQDRLKLAVLGARWHVNPPLWIVDGQFDLIDVETGEEMIWQIVQIDSPLAPVPDAAQRTGLAQGGKRYGVFEDPKGLKCDLHFLAKNIAPLGYRTYRLRQRPDRPLFARGVNATETTLENEFYHLKFDPLSGSLISLLDKSLGRELTDSNAAHSFGSFIVRFPDGREQLASCQKISLAWCGATGAAVRSVHSVAGHPVIEQTVTLMAGIKRIDWAVHVLKDPTPLLETIIAFPFKLPEGCFRIEEPLVVRGVGEGLLPGAFSNRLVTQAWTSTGDGNVSIIWSSLDAPVVSLGRLWPSRVSPAHACVRSPDLDKPPQKEEELHGGAIYSCIFNNNFGTNFAVSQSGATLFRYSFTSCGGVADDHEAASFGDAAASPLMAMFTKHPGHRTLPPAGGFLSVNPSTVKLLALKQAEDGRGLILRLWNSSQTKISTCVCFSTSDIEEAGLTNIMEEDTGKSLRTDKGRINLKMEPSSVETIRVQLR